MVYPTDSLVATAIARYQKHISRPLLDRVDIHIEMPHADYEKLAEQGQVETSATMRARVQAARERQLQRFAGTRLTCNAEMGPAEVRVCCEVEPSAEKITESGHATTPSLGSGLSARLETGSDNS